MFLFLPAADLKKERLSPATSNVSMAVLVVSDQDVVAHRHFEFWERDCGDWKREKGGMEIDYGEGGRFVPVIAAAHWCWTCGSQTVRPHERYPNCLASSLLCCTSPLPLIHHSWLIVSSLKSLLLLVPLSLVHSKLVNSIFIGPGRLHKLTCNTISKDTL